MFYFFKPTKFKILLTIVFSTLGLIFNYLQTFKMACGFGPGAGKCYIISLVIIIVYIYLLSSTIYWIKNRKEIKTLHPKVFFPSMVMFFISLIVVILISIIIYLLRSYVSVIDYVPYQP